MTGTSCSSGVTPLALTSTDPTGATPPPGVPHGTTLPYLPPFKELNPNEFHNHGPRQHALQR